MIHNDQSIPSDSQVFWTCKGLAGQSHDHSTAEIRGVARWRLGAIITVLRHHYGWPDSGRYAGRQNIRALFVEKRASTAASCASPIARAWQIWG